ncbi:nucleoside hydrolase [Corynebacterium wankanglinii]|uniref:Nucleoside hydrolase n=1 Tax=Corynebacterium wankanglinii TaxID=2735136 RepID=A0A838CKY3_9CORY|nr:nucleoside hydrolase [Corynebacterium wankanglinii]MBA1835512.1 nucleoside hydrolase [Corynebacterium wankanglinii]
MRVILDCDPGIDDTYAIIFLTAAAQAGLIGLDCVTTTSGNAPADQCARNAAWVLGLCGLPIIPLAAGVPAPLEVELTTTPETHGDTGLGYATAPERHVEHDWDALWIDSIDRGTDDLHLIVTGPLTNLAAFAHTHPEHFAKLKHITVMGGAVNYPGNTTPSAEWNFWVDPHAAADVFAMAPVPITLCSLGVTERMLLDPEVLAELVDRLGGSPVAEHLEAITRFYFEFHEDVGEGYRAQIHDLLTVLIALDLVDYQATETTVAVEADSELMRGTSVADLRGIWEREPNARLVTEADVEAAWERFGWACDVHAKVAAGDAEIEELRHLRADD